MGKAVDLAGTRKRRGDQIFRRVSTTAGGLILLTLAAVAMFLIAQALPAFTEGANQPSALRDVKAAGGLWQWALPLAFGTVWAATLAMVIAVPISIGVALYLTHYAPRRVAKLFGYVIDLLAAVPSVVFGLWGLIVLAPFMHPIYVWLNQHLSWIPLFNAWEPYGSQGEMRPVLSTGGQNMLTAAMVLALMVLPIVTALTREVFQQTPTLHQEASLALGATKWEMIRQAVLPYGASGIVSACMLGLGRALGETMAVAMILPGIVTVSFKVLTYNNPDTIAAFIAKNFPEADGFARHQLIAGGLVLFGITLLVNVIARWILLRRRVKE